MPLVSRLDRRSAAMRRTVAPLTPSPLMLAPLVLALLAGCGGSEPQPAAEPQVPEWVRSDAAAAPADDAQLALRLQPGDRFPLRKVIEREVVQATPQGTPQVHRLQIELTLGMTVEAVQSGETRFRVRYDRVRYVHHMGEEVVEFDSFAPPTQLPLSLRAWQAMVGDGFVFWVGRDNQIARVEGFQEFLDRCLAVIPPDRRDEVLASIESSSGENGVTDFVDNAVGLLPYGDRKAPGDAWQRTRHIGRPVPMVLDNTYTLKELDDRQAVIQISGTITPSTTLMETARSDIRRVRMTVREGHTFGTCTIYRDTGLPQRSRVEHDMLMTVQLSGGTTFDQRVRGVTTIEAFPMPSGGSSNVITLDDARPPASR